ncbi:hypothetical protein AB4455_10405 [Vibrio sp. 10N.261.46.E12]|uniref:hypothetical protein n=1 Tax=unclassified Vibrio TaxID=2614977 RepID=UPI00097583BD|nr:MULTISPECIES: hypothetical protein [unclassified Vibrio]OMO36124.1 hypothetical protein BH584_04940 [Vibrio sp. 10N.261.45.E1]PMJ34524.1 hypothetical protein BCU27_03595 [Vibrio sp. 10N.286.45.B6]PML88052.1 hypothetical protein BCT66_10665 [Vibrio sp. 10N.261.49.E11]PMM67380.1 hypothetical protein BCT48_15135 [Vibrio sp. 10N.261.46.F12]PMM81737.1 hypothetical protein BCT46_15120 [Vibrio sp. 10N.261.46.E8]
MQNIKNAAVAGILVSLLAGCQSTNKDQGAVVDQLNSTTTTQVDAYSLFEAIKVLQLDWTKKLADIEQYKLYSPTTVKQLKDVWEETTEVYKELAEDPTDATEDYSLFSSITYAEKYDELLGSTEKLFNKLVALKVVADDVLADANDQMEYLDKLEAKAAYSTQYRQVYMAYSDLFMYVDNDKVDQARVAQDKFLEQAKTLEVSVVTKKYVAPLKETLKKYHTKRLNISAPLTYKKAQTEIEKTELTVKSDSRDFDAIEKSVEVAVFELDHIVSVSSEVSRLSAVKNSKFESVVLNYEKSLLQLSEAVNGEDYRNKSLADQAKAILLSLKAAKDDESSVSKKLSDALSKTESEIASLMVKLAAAAKESEMAKKELANEKANSERLSELLKSLSKTGQNIADVTPSAEKVEEVVTEDKEPVEKMM